MTSSAVVRQTVRMAWMQVHAGQDHLSQFTNRKPVDALVEMIWNGLDAEADLVTVDFETASIVPGDRELLHIAGPRDQRGSSRSRLPISRRLLEEILERPYSER